MHSLVLYCSSLHPKPCSPGSQHPTMISVCAAIPFVWTLQDCVWDPPLRVSWPLLLHFSLVILPFETLLTFCYFSPTSQFIWVILDNIYIFFLIFIFIYIYIWVYIITYINIWFKHFYWNIIVLCNKLHILKVYNLLKFWFISSTTVICHVVCASHCTECFANTYSVKMYTFIWRELTSLCCWVFLFMNMAKV